MATEFEIKLRAKSVEQLGEILRDAQVVKLAQEKLREIHMRTTYFDTAEPQMDAPRAAGERKERRDDENAR